jgi:hypothetical protein
VDRRAKRTQPGAADPRWIGARNEPNPAPDPRWIGARNEANPRRRDPRWIGARQTSAGPILGARIG